jgi:hypothetical protein
MGCVVDARERCETAATSLDACVAVLDATVLAPEEEPLDKWTIELSLRPPHDAVPPRVAEIVAEYDLGIQKAGPRGPTHHAVLLPP